MPATISRTLPLSLIPSISPCEAERPLSVGAFEARFIQRWITMPEFRFFVKEFQKRICLRLGSHPTRTDRPSCVIAVTDTGRGLCYELNQVTQDRSVEAH